MLGPGRVGVCSHSFGHTTDILRTKDRTLQTEEPDTTDKEPDILRTRNRTSYGHPTDKEPDITGHEGTTPLCRQQAEIALSGYITGCEHRLDPVEDVLDRVYSFCGG